MPPLPHFTATCLHSEDMGDYHLLSLADDEDDPRDYLIFQRAHEFTEQDIRLGMNAVHVERNDQGWSGYGGLERVILRRDSLELELNEQGSRFMGGVQAMRVSFDFSSADFACLCKGLRVCFAGFAYFEDRTLVDEAG